MDTGRPKNRRAWWPCYFISGVFIVLLAMFAMGGTVRILSWYLTLCLPVLGLCYLLGGIIRLAWTLRVSLPLAVTINLGLVAMIPVTWLPMLQIWPMAFPIDIETTAPRLFIRVPTNETMRVSNGGNDPGRNVHVFLPPQRWAYDLLIAPHPAAGAELTDFGCYGVPVVAPVSGEVVEVTDGVADSMPGVVDVTANAYGNHVVIRPEQGGFLFVAHLQPGSISVEKGSDVEEGEVIGRCGNSGNTTGPHVHVHYQAQDPAKAGLLAQGLPLFFRDHAGPEMPNGGQRVEQDRTVYFGDEITHLSSN